MQMTDTLRVRYYRIALDAKTPVPQIDGDRALSSIVLSENNRLRGVALSGAFEFQSLQRSNLEPLA